jgi:hypothetical protein
MPFRAGSRSVLIATRARAELRIVLRPYVSMAREKNVATAHDTPTCIAFSRDEKKLLADQAAGHKAALKKISIHNALAGGLASSNSAGPSKRSG